MLPWYIGLAIIAIVDAFIGHQSYCAKCEAPGITQFLVLGAVPGVYRKGRMNCRDGGPAGPPDPHRCVTEPMFALVLDANIGPGLKPGRGLGVAAPRRQAAIYRRQIKLYS
jgi:hypothetical protein